MSEAPVYNQKGEKVGSFELPENVFGLAWNEALVSQVVFQMQDNARVAIAHAKGRGEVRGGGKKPWRQKGTGRARHGSTRSPLWVGGGVTHGPKKEKRFDGKINKKMKVKALYTALSEKFRTGEVMFVESLNTEGKTKNAAVSLKNLSTVSGFEKMTYKKGKRALVVLPAKNETVQQSFRNLGAIGLKEARNISPVDVLTYQYLVIVNPTDSVKAVSGRGE